MSFNLVTYQPHLKEVGGQLMGLGGVQFMLAAPQGGGWAVANSRPAL